MVLRRLYPETSSGGSLRQVDYGVTPQSSEVYRSRRGGDQGGTEDQSGSSSVWGGGRGSVSVRYSSSERERRVLGEWEDPRRGG